MFYCDNCGKKKGLPHNEWQAKSYGICDVCGKKRPCNDVKTEDLPSKGDERNAKKCEKEKTDTGQTEE